jgi:PilZ domain
MTNSYVQRRKGEPRVKFELPLEVRVMTIDGTWSGEGVLIDIADNGARLKMTGRATELTEFFLILNSFGPPVFRHCKRVWVEGQLMGVSFNKTNIGIKTFEEVRREAEPV